MTTLVGTRPSLHVTWDEASCWNRTGRVWRGLPSGALISAYPSDWRLTRLPVVCRAFELVRAIHDLKVTLLSFYRTRDYNASVGGAEHSLHCEGLAFDAVPPAGIPVEQWHDEILALAETPAGQIIRGIGYGAEDKGNMVHIDCRSSDHLVRWTYPL